MATNAKSIQLYGATQNKIREVYLQRPPIPFSQRDTEKTVEQHVSLNLQKRLVVITCRNRLHF